MLVIRPVRVGQQVRVDGVHEPALEHPTRGGFALGLRGRREAIAHDAPIGGGAGVEAPVEEAEIVAEGVGFEVAELGGEAVLAGVAESLLDAVGDGSRNGSVGH